MGAGESVWENTFEIIVKEEVTAEEEEDRRNRNAIINLHDNDMETDIGTMGWGFN